MKNLTKTSQVWGYANGIKIAKKTYVKLLTNLKGNKRLKARCDKMGKPYFVKKNMLWILFPDPIRSNEVGYKKFEFVPFRGI